MGIQANELRIGNLFYDEDNTPCYFAGAWQRQDGWIYRDSANNTYKESEMYPIPLTPEILEKAGFVLEDDGISPYHRLVISRTQVISIEDDWSIGLNAENESSGVGYASHPNIVRYVHQFQNLYFALTGEELTIRL